MQDSLKKYKGSFLVDGMLVLVSCLLVWFGVTREMYWLLGIIPLGAAGLYFSVFRPLVLLYTAAAFVPLSTSLKALGIHLKIPIDISLPLEPVLVVLSGLILFYISSKRSSSFRKHPTFQALLVYLLVLVTGVFTSSEPAVSLKFLIAKTWLILPGMFLGFYILSSRKNALKFSLSIGISAALVVVYSTIQYFLKGQSLNAAHFVMQPFYKDHTIYGASITFLAFLLTGSVALAKPQKRWIYILLALVLWIGVFYSYSRAAWLSVIFALACALVFLLRISYRWVMGIGLSVCFLVFALWVPLMHWLNKNNQDSSGNIQEHVRSVTNVSTDDSNVERLNRWYCAIELWKQKPLLGWGPNTYQFEYAPFQKSYTRSGISTNDGNLGNAHSEYLGVLAEGGLFGLAGFLAFLFAAAVAGRRAYILAENKTEKLWRLCLVLAVFSYLFHGLLNNYLDQAKVAFPLFCVVGILMSSSQSRKNAPELSGKVL